jgi:hypothetical protein
MTAMAATLFRCLRGSVIISGCALVLASTLLGGCTRTLVGKPYAVAPGQGQSDPIPVAGLLIEPERFPQRYPAIVLDGMAVNRALQDVDGVAAATVVTPPECAPPLDPLQAAAVEGIDNDTASSLIVAVTRGSSPVGVRAEQLAACPSFTAVGDADKSAVAVTVLPAPPVNADDTYAVDQTVTIQSSGLTRRTFTLAAQVGDVAISATWLHQGTPESAQDNAPDTQALDHLFTDAVLKVRRVGGP